LDLNDFDEIQIAVYILLSELLFQPYANWQMI